MIRLFKFLSIFLISLVPYLSYGQGQDLVTITKCYDGDSGNMTIHTMYGIDVKEKFRLFGLNAPEVRGVQRPRGLITRDTLISFMSGKQISVNYIFDSKNRRMTGKYGRTLVFMYADSININKWLVENNLAIEKEY